LVHDDTACLEVATLPGPLQLSFIINRIEDTAKYICFKNGKMAAACSASHMQLLFLFVFLSALTRKHQCNPRTPLSAGINLQPLASCPQL